MDDAGHTETPDDPVPPEPEESGESGELGHADDVDVRLREQRELEDDYVDLDAIPLPRPAGVMDPQRKRDLQFFGFGCGLLMVSVMALGYALWGVVQAIR